MKLKVNLISSLKDEVHSRGFKENGYSYLRSETIHGGDSQPTIGGLQCSREVTHFVTKLFFNHESVNFIYMHAECKSFEQKKKFSLLFTPPSLLFTCWNTQLSVKQSIGWFDWSERECALHSYWIVAPINVSLHLRLWLMEVMRDSSPLHHLDQSRKWCQNPLWGRKGWRNPNK